MENVPSLFFRWILCLPWCYEDIDPFPVSMAYLLGYWRLHYFNILALLCRTWRKSLLDSLERFEWFACGLYLHCRRTGQSPRLIVDIDPWCHLCKSIKNRRAQAAIAQQMLFLHPYRKLRSLEVTSSCTIKYPGGLTVIAGKYPPWGMTIALYRHSSVPSFQKKETTRCRSRSASMSF